MDKKKWLTTNYPEIIFEDNTVGRLPEQTYELWLLARVEITSSPAVPLRLRDYMIFILTMGPL